MVDINTGYDFAIDQNIKQRQEISRLENLVAKLDNNIANLIIEKEKLEKLVWQLYHAPVNNFFQDCIDYLQKEVNRLRGYERFDNQKIVGLK